MEYHNESNEDKRRDFEQAVNSEKFKLIEEISPIFTGDIESLRFMKVFELQELKDELEKKNG